MFLVQWLIWDLLWKGNCETARRRKSNSSAKECFRVAFSSLHFLLSFYIVTDVIKCGVWLRFRYVHSCAFGCESCSWTVRSAVSAMLRAILQLLNQFHTACWLPPPLIKFLMHFCAHYNSLWNSSSSLLFLAFRAYAWGPNRICSCMYPVTFGISSLGLLYFCYCLESAWRNGRMEPDCWLEGLAFESQRRLSILENVQIGSGSHSAPYSVVTGVLCGGKAAGAWRSLSSSHVAASFRLNCTPPVPPRHVRDVTNMYCTLLVTSFVVITMCTSLEDFFRGSKWYPPQMAEKTATSRRD
jgi:hypothetical protein